jgi:hypothetical protein
MFTKKIEIFWTYIASTMACPNFKNGPKYGLGPLGVKHLKNNVIHIYIYMLWKREQLLDLKKL